MLLACIAGWRRLVALLVPASVPPAALLLVAAASATSSTGTQKSRQQDVALLQGTALAAPPFHVQASMLVEANTRTPRYPKHLGVRISRNATTHHNRRRRMILRHTLRRLLRQHCVYKRPPRKAAGRSTHPSHPRLAIAQHRLAVW